MAFYSIKYEGKLYASTDLYRELTGIYGGALFAEPRVSVFGVPAFGPLTADQIDKVDKIEHIYQDFDAQVGTHEPALGDEETKLIHVDDDMLVEYAGRKYIRVIDVPIAHRYRLLKRLAHVRIFGRGLYAALDTRDNQTEKPIVLSTRRS